MRLQDKGKNHILGLEPRTSSQAICNQKSPSRAKSYQSRSEPTLKIRTNIICSTTKKAKYSKAFPYPRQYPSNKGNRHRGCCTRIIQKQGVRIQLAIIQKKLQAAQLIIQHAWGLSCTTNRVKDVSEKEKKSNEIKPYPDVLLYYIQRS